GVIITSTLGLPLWLAFVAAAAVTGVMGYLLERLALRPLRSKSESSHLAPLISTIGVSIFLENLADQLFGSGNHPVQNSWSEINFTIGTVNIYIVQIVIFCISIALMIALSYWLLKTKGGKALRATAESLE